MIISTTLDDFPRFGNLPRKVITIPTVCRQLLHLQHSYWKCEYIPIEQGFRHKPLKEYDLYFCNGIPCYTDCSLLEGLASSPHTTVYLNVQYTHRSDEAEYWQRVREIDDLLRG